MMENLICILAFTAPLVFRIHDWKKPYPYLSIILQILLWIVFHSVLISAAVMMILFVVYGYCVKKNTLLTCMAEGMLLITGFSLPVLLVLVRSEYAMVQPYLYLPVNCLIASGIETAEKAVSDSSERLVWSMNTVAALCLSYSMISLYFINRKSVSALLIGFLYVCTLFCLVLYMKEKQKSEELERIRSMISLSREQMGQWQEHAMETVQIRHDMNHHLRMIRELIEKQDMDAAVMYINQTVGRNEAMGSKVYSFNPYIDSLLKYKKELYNGIDMDISVACSVMKEEASYDVCLVLSNLIDNAVEEIERNHLEKKVAVILHQQGEMLAVRVSNPYAGHKSLRTEKKDRDMLHGNGLAIVRSIAEKYDGTVSISQDRQFMVSVMMNMKEDDA